MLCNSTSLLIDRNTGNSGMLFNTIERFINPEREHICHSVPIEMEEFVNYFEEFNQREV